LYYCTEQKFTAVSIHYTFAQQSDNHQQAICSVGSDTNLKQVRNMGRVIYLKDKIEREIRDILQQDLQNGATLEKQTYQPPATN
jgi:Ni,Fe-hydrogenase III component G